MSEPIQTNPFNRGVKAPVKTPNQNTAPKTDTMRERIKEQLLDALELKGDETSHKYTSAHLSNELENAIYEATGKNSKDKPYREKSKKIVARLKGARNNNIRSILKTGAMEVSELVALTDKQLDDNNTYAKYGSVATEPVDAKKAKGIMKPPVINIPRTNIDLTASMSGEIPDEYKQDPIPQVEENVDTNTNTNNLDKNIDSNNMDTINSHNDPLDNPVSNRNNFSMGDNPQTNNEAYQLANSLSRDNLEGTTESGNINNSAIGESEQRPSSQIEMPSTESKYILNQSSNSIEVPHYKAPQVGYTPVSRNNHVDSIKQSNTTLNTSSHKGESLRKLQEIIKKKDPSDLPVKYTGNNKLSVKAGLVEKKTPDTSLVASVQEEDSNNISNRDVSNIEPAKTDVPVNNKPEAQIETVNQISVNNNNRDDINRQTPKNRTGTNFIGDKPGSVAKKNPFLDSGNAEVEQTTKTEENVTDKDKGQKTSNKLEQPIHLNQQNRPSPLKTEQRENIIFNNDERNEGGLFENQSIRIGSPQNETKSNLTSNLQKYSFLGSTSRIMGVEFRDQFEKYKVEIKSLKEQKVTAETNLEIATKRNEIYQKEIEKLKELVSTLRSQHSKTTEENSRLELSKLNQNILVKDRQNQVLTKENSQLKGENHKLVESLQNLLEENKRFRSETEKRFGHYNDEIEKLQLNSHDFAHNKSAESFNSIAITTSKSVEIAPPKSSSVKRPSERIAPEKQEPNNQSNINNYRREPIKPVFSDSESTQKETKVAAAESGLKASEDFGFNIEVDNNKEQSQQIYQINPEPSQLESQEKFYNDKEEQVSIKDEVIETKDEKVQETPNKLLKNTFEDLLDSPDKQVDSSQPLPVQTNKNIKTRPSIKESVAKSIPNEEAKNKVDHVPVAKVEHSATNARSNLFDDFDGNTQNDEANIFQNVQNTKKKAETRPAVTKKEVQPIKKETLPTAKTPASSLFDDDTTLDSGNPNLVDDFFAPSQNNNAKTRPAVNSKKSNTPNTASTTNTNLNANKMTVTSNTVTNFKPNKTPVFENHAFGGGKDAFAMFDDMDQDNIFGSLTKKNENANDLFG